MYRSRRFLDARARRGRRFVSVGVAPSVGSLHGRLALRFAARGAHTILSHANVVAPLKIVRPFRLDDGRLLVQLLSLGPGLCGGDCCSVDVSVEAGARVVLVAQSATRILAMRDTEPARQRVHLTVRAEGSSNTTPASSFHFQTAASCSASRLTWNQTRGSASSKPLRWAGPAVVILAVSAAL